MRSPCRTWKPVFVFAVLVLWTAPVRADFYQYKDKGGTIHFVDEITKVPPEYQDQVKHRGAANPLPTGDESDVSAQARDEFADAADAKGDTPPGSWLSVMLPEVKAAFYVPQSMAATGEGSNPRTFRHPVRPLQAQVRLFMDLKPETVIDFIGGVYQLASGYRALHPGEKYADGENFDLVAYPRSGHHVFAFNTVSGGGLDAAAHVQLYFGPHGCFEVRWSGLDAESIRGIERSSRWVKNMGEGATLKPFAAKDLVSPVVLGAAAVVLVPTAIILGIVLIRRRND